MKEKKKIIWKWLHFRLENTDFDKVHTNFKKSTERNLSEYARKILLKKPMTFNQRNQSLDDFMAELIRLRQELNAIGNNYNQAVKTLHQLRELSDIKTWLVLNEKNRNILEQKVEDIRLKIYQINDQWLR